MSLPGIPAAAGIRLFRFEIGDALAEDGDEISHDVDQRPFDAEEEGVEILLADVIADLAGESGVELVFGDGLELGAGFVGGAVLQVDGHVEDFRGDGDFVDFLPGHFEIEAAGLDDAHLRIAIALAFFRMEELAEWSFVSGGVADAFGTAEAGFDRAFVLTDGVHAEDEDAYDEPGECSEEETGEEFHGCEVYRVWVQELIAPFV